MPLTQDIIPLVELKLSSQADEGHSAPNLTFSCFDWLALLLPSCTLLGAPE